MQMQVRTTVGVGDFLVINLAEPVVRGDGATVGQDQAADGVVDGGILLDTPVISLEIGIDQFLVVKQALFRLTHVLVLFPVEDVRFGDGAVAGKGERGLDAVLDVLDGNLSILDFLLVVAGGLQGKKADDVVVVWDVGCVERFLDCFFDFRQVEVDDFSVPLDDLIHAGTSCGWWCGWEKSPYGCMCLSLLPVLASIRPCERYVHHN